MKSVLDQIGGIVCHDRIVILLGSTAQNPSHVCPPPAIAGCMRITRPIRMRVVDTVRHNPIDRPASKRERAADRQKVFNQLWCLITTMSQESVKANSNP